MRESAAAQQEQESFLAPALVGASAAVKQARDRQGRKRQATIISVAADRSVCMVVDDNDLTGAPYGATVITPAYLKAGDRVMLEHYPPHGTLVVGLLRGGKTGWQYAGDSQPGNPGFFGAGWNNDAGTGPLDTASYSWVGWTRSDDVVELRGRAHRISGVANLIVFLPPGFRPRSNLAFCVMTAPIGVPGTLLVQSDGQVFAISGTVDSGSGGFMHLDGIHFTVE